MRRPSTNDCRWLVGLALAMVLSACTSPEPPPPPPIVGVLVPLSGEGAPAGEGLLQGAQLALAETNAMVEDSERIQLVIEDAGSTPDDSLDALSRLREAAPVSLVIGVVDAAAAKAVAARARDQGIAFLTPSSVADEPMAGAWHLRPSADDDRRFLAALFAADPTIHRLAILQLEASGTAFEATNLVAETARNAGRTLLAGSPTRTTADPLTDLEAIARARPDAIILVGTIDSITALRAAAPTLETPLIALTTDADPMLLAVPDESTEAAFRRVPGALESPLVHFTERYLETYGARPDIWAGYGYDLMDMATAALRDRASLTAASGFAGVTGYRTLSPHGRVHRALHLVLDGRGSQPSLPVWILASPQIPIDHRIRATTGTPADPPPEITASDSTPTEELPRPTGPLADRTVVVCDFLANRGRRATAMETALQPEAATVVVAEEQVQSGLPRLSTAHIYRRETGPEGAAGAQAIEALIGLASTQHPNLESGQDDVRRLFADHPDADFFVVVH